MRLQRTSEFDVALVRSRWHALVALIRRLNDWASHLSIMIP